MSKITLDNLSDNLKEYLNGLGLTSEQVNELINNVNGDLNDLYTTNKSSLVGAINELFQNANNGKELIASAIGEPLSKEDTFSAMSNDINSLLSTFKTNMMNNGITVESSDKFKSLIDKIATLADSEGKGIQYSTGTSSVVKQNTTYTRINGTTNGYYYIEINDLPFEPIFIIAKKNAGAAICFINASLGFYYTSYNTSGKHITIHTYGDGSGTPLVHDISGATSIDFTNIKLPVDVSNTGTWDWYAIGVGEEDTTLRDSLANILENKGVDVTEDDDMASLITKVDSIQTGGGLDIISATELPIEVVENQVCLITDSFGKVYIANEKPNIVLNNGDVYIKCRNDGYYATVQIPTSTSNISLNLNTVVQIKNGVEEKINGYVGINGQWVPTDNIEFYLYKSGVGLHSSVGGFEEVSSEGTYSVNTSHIYLYAHADFGDMTIRSKNKIDLTEYSKIEVSSSNDYGSLTFTIGGKTLDLANSDTATLDISNVNGLDYFEISKGANYQNQSGYIYYIKLIKEFE